MAGICRNFTLLGCDGFCGVPEAYSPERGMASLHAGQNQGRAGSHRGLAPLHCAEVGLG